MCIRDRTLVESDDEDLSVEGYKYILAGLKIMPNAPLTYRYSRKGNNLFTGDIWCFDTDDSQEGDYLSLENFGYNRRFNLVYMTKDEMKRTRLN